MYFISPFPLGGGVEMPEHYPQWKVEHAKFETPTVIQSSFTRLVEGMCNRWDSRWQ